MSDFVSLTARTSIGGTDELRTSGSTTTEALGRLDAAATRYAASNSHKESPQQEAELPPSYSHAPSFSAPLSAVSQRKRASRIVRRESKMGEAGDIVVRIPH